MSDHRELQDAMERALTAFARHGWVQRVQITHHRRPDAPYHATAEVNGQFNLTDFSRGVLMELDRPGILGGERVTQEQVLGGGLPNG